MTNDRAIVVLKCAHLAMGVAWLAVFFSMITQRPDPDKASVLTLLLPLVCAILVWAVHLQVGKALKKRVGDDAFSVWKKKVVERMFVGAFILAIAALFIRVVAERDWGFFVFLVSSPEPAMMLFAVVVVFCAVPALMKKRMEADAFAKFNRKYAWAITAVLAAALAWQLWDSDIPLWISK